MGATDIELSAEQRATRMRFEQLFSEELLPSLRRMGQRALGAGATRAEADEADVEARRMVWDTLTRLGGHRLGLPQHRGGRQAALVVVCELMGSALYQSAFPDTVTATELLLACGGHDPLLERIGAGAAVALAVRARDDGHRFAPGTMVADPQRGFVQADRSFVPFAPDVEYLIVVGDTPGGIRLALVPRDHPTVAVRRHDDVGRGDMYAVTFDHTPVAPQSWLGGRESAGSAWAAALTTARIRHAAYLVGLSQAALDLTVAYAKERRQFGQPIARFQALAFRLAALATRIEGARLLTNLAAWESDQGMDARLTTLQALAMAGDLARQTATESIQIHGAYGMTEACDAQLFYRRAVIDAVWLGSPTELRREAAPLLRARAGEAHGRLWL